MGIRGRDTEPLDTSWLCQAAAVPVRVSPGGPEVLLISTKRGRWSVPRGWLEAGEDETDAAQREAFEEAGVFGRVLGPPLGCFGRNLRGNPVRVAVFAMQVETELTVWPEMHKRERRWVTLPEAPRMITRWDLARIVGRARPELFVGTNLRRAV